MKEAMQGELEELRRRIDMLDEHLVRLLNARAACALEIGRLKRALDIPIYQPEREALVLAHVEGVNTGPLDHPAIKRLFERIIDEARHLERTADHDHGATDHTEHRATDRTEHRATDRTEHRATDRTDRTDH